MKRILSLLLIAALMISGAVLFTGCSEEGEKNYPVTVNGVTLDSEPKHIVVLDSAVADILSYMSYDRNLVARSQECDQEFLTVFPSVGSAAEPSVDDIVALGADLVIIDDSTAESVCRALNDKQIKTVAFQPATDLASLKELYISIGTLLGGNVSGKKKSESSYTVLMNSLGKYKSLITGVAKTSAYLYLDSTGQLCTFTKGSFEQKVFDYNGSLNTLANQQTPQVNPSELRMGSPGCIFYDDEAVLTYLRNDETLMNLPALKKNNVHRIALKDFSRCGTTWEQIVYDMASFLDNSSKPATQDEATPDEPTDAPSYDDSNSDDLYSDDDYSDGSYDSYDDSGDN